MLLGVVFSEGIPRDSGEERASIAITRLMCTSVCAVHLPTYHVSYSRNTVVIDSPILITLNSHFQDIIHLCQHIDRTQPYI